MINFFHRLIDKDSAKLRKLITEKNLESHFSFFNVDISQKAKELLIPQFGELKAPVFQVDGKWVTDVSEMEKIIQSAHKNPQ